MPPRKARENRFRGRVTLCFLLAVLPGPACGNLRPNGVASAIRVADACALLGWSRRQVFRLLQGLPDTGVASLVSKRRGKPSNRRLPDAVRITAQ